MRLSARNQIKGTVTGVTKGATSRMSVSISGTGDRHASITNEAVDELGIKSAAKSRSSSSLRRDDRSR